MKHLKKIGNFYFPLEVSGETKERISFLIRKEILKKIGNKFHSIIMTWKKTQAGRWQLRSVALIQRERQKCFITDPNICCSCKKSPRACSFWYLGEWAQDFANPQLEQLNLE